MHISGPVVKLIAQLRSGARWSVRMKDERTALSALPRDISRPKRLGKAVRLRRGYYPRGCPLEWPEVIDGDLAENKRIWWLLSLHKDSTSPIQMSSPIEADSSQSCLLCCPPGHMPGRLPAKAALFAEYGPCRLPGCAGHVCHVVWAACTGAATAPPLISQ